MSGATGASGATGTIRTRGTTGMPGRDPIAPHRDGGLLAAWLPAGRLPVPEVALLALALVLTVVPLLPWVPTTGGWPFVLGAWLLAVVAAAGRVLPRLQWPVPALLRGIEYVAVLVLVGGSGWSYALLAVLAFHHYDIVYRVRLLGTGPTRRLELLGGGWSVRLAVLLTAAAADVVLPATQIMILVLTPVFVVESVATWVSAHRPAPTR
jgi:hypothetical protein